MTPVGKLPESASIRTFTLFHGQCEYQPFRQNGDCTECIQVFVQIQWAAVVLKYQRR